MGLRLGKFLLRIYLLLWISAVGGVIGANAAGTIATLFFLEENKIEFLRPWWHGGWYAGTLLFFVGAAWGKLRMIQGTSLGGFKGDRDGTGQVSEAASENKRNTSVERKSAPKLSLKVRVGSVCKGAFVGGLAGGFLGVLLGGSLLVFWFSIAYSPFAPTGRAANVVGQTNMEPRSAQRRMREPGARLTIRSSNRGGLYLCLVPTVIGIAAGAIGLGTIAFIYPEEQRKEIDSENERDDKDRLTREIT